MANTTADKLAKLESTKADLKAAILEKGGSVGDVFSEYPAAVRSFKNIDTYEKEQIMESTVPPLYGLGSDAVPSDVLAWIGKYNQYWWRRRKKIAGYRIVYKQSSTTPGPEGNYILLVQSTNTGVTGTINYSDNLEIGPSGEIVGLKQPTSSISISYSKHDAAEVLKGKFIKSRRVYPGGGVDEEVALAYIYPDATITTWEQSSSNRYVNATKLSIDLRTEPYPGDWEYLQSSDRSAYPDSGEQDGYEYQYFGVPFENAVTAPKVSIGSYIGTDTFGFENQNSLDFDFEPQVVFISSEKQNNESRIAILVRGSDRGIRFQYLRSDDSMSGVIYGVAATWESKTVHWYNYEGADEQMNKSGITYRYRAWGV